MVGNLIQQQFHAAQNWPFGAALTVVMMAFLLIWMVFYLRSAARAAERRPHEPVAAEAPRRPGQPGRREAAHGFRPPALPARVPRPLLPRLFAPILIVALFSFNAQLAAGLRRLQPALVRRFFESDSLRSSLVASLEIALVTMLVATVLGTTLAFGLVRAARASRGANVLMLIPLVTPEIVAGVSALLLFTQVGLELSLTTIMLRTSRSRSPT